MPPIHIALVGDYNPEVTAHQAIPRALDIAARANNTTASWDWVGTAGIDQDPQALLSTYHAIWCVPASPYASMEGALAAIRLARQSGRPFLGTCGGCQHAILEYARSVLGLREADHAESNPDAGLPLISELSCSLVEKTATIRLSEGSRLARIYEANEIHETYHCRYGLNPALEHLISGSTLHISGRDDAGEVRALELVNHPFFMCTLFQPERSGLAGQRHPLIDAFLSAALDRHLSVSLPA